MLSKLCTGKRRKIRRRHLAAMIRLETKKNNCNEPQIKYTLTKNYGNSKHTQSSTAAVHLVERRPNTEKDRRFYKAAPAGLMRRGIRGAPLQTNRRALLHSTVELNSSSPLLPMRKPFLFHGEWNIRHFKICKLKWRSLLHWGGITPWRWLKHEYSTFLFLKNANTLCVVYSYII